MEASYSGQRLYHSSVKTSQISALPQHPPPKRKQIYSLGAVSTKAVSLTSSAKTIASPPDKCQSMWQWSNHGPGLSVWRDDQPEVVDDADRRETDKHSP